MAGVLIGSIGSGQIITATGRYKVFPIAGTALAAIGMYLLSRLDAGSSVAYGTVGMFVMGLGLGLVMQVLVLAVQNAVDYSELGVATSGATLFRSMGGVAGDGGARCDLHEPADRRAHGLPRRPGRQRLDRSERPAAPAVGDPRRLHRRVHGRAVDGVHRRRRDPARRVPPVVARRGAAAAPDGRDGRRRRGLRVTEVRRFAAGAHARAVAARRPRAHARVHPAHGRRCGARPLPRLRVAARAVRRRPDGRSGRPRRGPRHRRRVDPRRARLRSTSAGSSATAHRPTRAARPCSACSRRAATA